MFLRFAISLFLVAHGSCFFFVSTAPTTSPNVIIVFSSGPWAFDVDRTWMATPGSPTYPASPSAQLPESDYRYTSSGARYSIVVGAEGETVSINGAPPIKGTRSSQSGDRVTYNLTEGLFAGGRLVMWKDGSGYQGELTVYGSGVPVVRSERGKVVRAE